jgi:hypothetical protein
MKRVYDQSLVPFCRSVFSWRTDDVGQQAIVLDLRCVSWILQTSLDKIDHLSAFNHLWSMPQLGEFDPLLVVDCFNAFTSCISVNNKKLVIMGGMEPLATMAARGLSRTLCHLILMDPTSSVLTDLRRRYRKAFPPKIDSSSVPFNSTMGLIHGFVSRPWNSKNIKWGGCRLPSQDDIPFAQSMMKAAQVGYQRKQDRKVPRWILRFVLDSLSRDPPSPASVVSSCLLIIAIDLGCDVSNTITFDERYV